MRHHANKVEALSILSACAKRVLTFSLVPLAPVESARSLPARSTRLILLTCIWMKMCFGGWKARLLIHYIGKTKSTMNVLQYFLTFSVERSVSLSCFFCVKTIVKTAWDLLLVSFMLVAATVLEGWTKLGNITGTLRIRIIAAVTGFMSIRGEFHRSINGKHKMQSGFWSQGTNPPGCLGQVLEISLLRQRRKREPGLLLPRRGPHTCMHQSHALIWMSSLGSD